MPTKKARKSQENPSLVQLNEVDSTATEAVDSLSSEPTKLKGGQAGHADNTEHHPLDTEGKKSPVLDSAQKTASGTFSIDGIDLAELKMSQDFEALTPVKDLLTDVPVRKPRKQEFVWVHPEHQITLPVIEHERDRRKLYLVSKPIQRVAALHVKLFSFRLAINAQGDMFIWPIPVPLPDGKWWQAHESAAEQADRAKAQWLQVYWHDGDGRYKVRTPLGNLGEPAWPDFAETPFEEIVKIAFKGRVISELENPVLKEILGKA